MQETAADELPPGEAAANYALDCGWGRLIFTQTFDSVEKLTGALREEKADCRDIAVYVTDPHVLLAKAPQEIFLDPSHTFRLDLAGYQPAGRTPHGFFVRRLTSRDDAVAMNRIYASRGMVQVPPEYFWSKRDARSLIYFVAEDERTGEIIGTVTGVDHARAFNDPEKGASLWCLATDPQARQPGIGEVLVHRLAEYFKARGAAWLDLSVLHDNEQAIALYEKVGFERVPLFSVKRKNSINEKLFTGPPEVEQELNPYAGIIVKEARRRGIQVDIIDAEGGFFRMTYGGSFVRCRESLSEYTTAVAMSICDDKAVTRRVVERAGVVVPRQIGAGEAPGAIASFLKKHGSVVVKPARGEQGRGISIGLTSVEAVQAAIEDARQVSNDVLIEEMIDGQDLRLVVINFKLVAAAIRKPPMVIGDGRSTIAELIEAQSRRRRAATGGESSIPVDGETERTLAASGKQLESVLAEGETLLVRKTANLHTGGTIHDVTEVVHPTLVQAAIEAARAIDIPVVGIDFMVKSPLEETYAFIEANERPGLANHEPQPTAERFVDLLFPLSMPTNVRKLLHAHEHQNGGAHGPAQD
ncbi:N-acetylglutaminylglutamine synthetase [Radicibacter daui]|uniref:N-acetylglutaminylglutamine synthetase n=1 Tax=Radicibacter daui TaxID=3064829 RepID=UPI004046FEEF